MASNVEHQSDFGKIMDELMKLTLMAGFNGILDIG